MPKNSRPDIQVLEDRIKRLKSQLLEFKDIKLHGVTKKRLSAVSSELEECVAIIHEMVDEGAPAEVVDATSAFNSCFDSNQAEFSSDDDLSDTLLIPSDNSAKSKLNASEIVRTYSARIKNCADTVGCSSGIIQVNQFCQVLNSWYQNRFAPDMRNPNFYFKASRIHEWVDLLILSAGHALNTGLFPSFISDLNLWIADLKNPKEQEWALPYSIMRMQKADASCCTQEAVLLEDIIKPVLYDDSFYPEERHSVKEIVINNGGFSETELDIDTVIKTCPKLIVTSSFDASKYQSKGVVNA